MVLADRARLALIGACTAVSILFSVLGPWLLGKATDLILTAVAASAGVDFSALARLLAVTLALQVLAALTNWQQAWLTNDVVQKLGRALRRLAEEKLGR